MSHRAVDDCRMLVEGFIDLLASRIEASLAGKHPPPMYREVVKLLEDYISTHGACSDNVDLLHEYQKAAKLALDYAMEALSRHMESLDEESYSFLSGVLTSYAVHIARMIAVVIDEAERLGGLAPVLLEAVEPLIYVAVARMLATARLVKKLQTRSVIELSAQLKDIIDIFIGEETSYLREIIGMLYGGNAAGKEADRAAAS